MIKKKKKLPQSSSISDTAFQVRYLKSKILETKRSSVFGLDYVINNVYIRRILNVNANRSTCTDVIKTKISYFIAFYILGYIFEKTETNVL